ncbi:hypothetical protein [Glycomyces paridis]|uniref:Uncharacterized protein n=1 Tax=Glycomyces paridis TaxID=2126555 RepID=A0A4S8P8E8_9ACTN|nr:hypothetical protein [Glycomyces paridis]THV26493.1 hypothetical protein E9998_18215 [Glycomyces paridis]
MDLDVVDVDGSGDLAVETGQAGQGEAASRGAGSASWNVISIGQRGSATRISLARPAPVAAAGNKGQVVGVLVLAAVPADQQDPVAFGPLGSQLPDELRELPGRRPRR